MISFLDLKKINKRYEEEIIKAVHPFLSLSL